MAPAARASRSPEPNEPGGLVVRDHSAAAPPVARITPRASSVRPSSVSSPAARPSAVTRSAVGAAALEDVDPGVLGDRGGQLAQDPAAGGAAARVGDAAARVAALEPEREVAVAVGVEAHAERLEVAEARGRLRGEDARGRLAHEAAAGRERVLEVQRGRVVGGERGGEPALGPVGRRLGQRAGGDQRDPGAFARRAERGVEAGGAGAHDDEVGPVHR